MVLMSKGHEPITEQFLMRNAASTMDISAGKLYREKPMKYNPDQALQATPTFKKGHKRSRSDVTTPQNNAGKSVTPGTPFPRTNSGGSIKKPLSIFAGFANRVRSAFEGKQQQEVCSNLKSNSKRRNNSKDKLRKSANRLSLQYGRHWPTDTRRADNETTFYHDEFNSSFDTDFSKFSCNNTVRNVAQQTPNRHDDCLENDDFDRRCSDITYDRYTSSNTRHRNGNDVTKQDVNLMVMGAQGVGKSAVIVRYLTKRFIGEYAASVESIYDQTINFDGKEVKVHIWDSSLPSIFQKSRDNSESDDCKSSTLQESLSSLTSSSTSSLSSTSSATFRFSYSSGTEEEKCCRHKNTATTTTDKQTRRQAKKYKIKNKLNKKKKEYDVVNNNKKEICSHDKKEEFSHEKQEERLQPDFNTDIQGRLSWTDGLVLVYSICDTSSFDVIRDVVRYVRGHMVWEEGVTGSQCRTNSGSSYGSSTSAFSQIPILLLGNKMDLEHRRSVDVCDLTAFARAYGCQAAEVSVSDGFEPVTVAFNSLLGNIEREKLPSETIKTESIASNVSIGHKRNMSM